MPRRQTFDYQEATRRYRAGETITDVARALGVSRTAVRRVVVPEVREQDNERRNRNQRTGACEFCGKIVTCRATFCMSHRSLASRTGLGRPKKRKRPLGEGVPVFNGSSDEVVVRTEDLVAILNDWYRCSREAYWTSLAERAGYRDSRSVHKVRSCDSPVTSITVADRLLTALGKAAMLVDGTLEILPNPRKRAL